MSFDPGFFECDSCGTVGSYSGDDEIEGGETFPLPAGWVEVTLRRKQANPNYLEELELRESAVQGMLEQQKAQMKSAKIEVSEEEIRAGIEATLRMQMPFSSAQFTADELDLHFCPRCIGTLRTLGSEAQEFLGIPAATPTPEASNG